MATKYAKYTMSQAAARAKAKVGKSNEIDGCLAECVNPAYNSPYDIPSPWGWGGNGRTWAINYWLNAVARGKVVKTSDPNSIPAGALAFMVDNADKGKAKPAGAGHVFIGAGSGYAYSTDRPKNGKWGKVTIGSIESAWAKTLVGYIEVTGDGYTLTDKAPVLPAVTAKTEKWTVDVNPGTVLNGRAAPVSGKVLYQRKPGYGITTVGRDPSGKWAVTRYGTWYAVAYLKARGAAPTPITIMSWNVKSPTLNGSWPVWSKRRDGQVALIKAIAPTVLLGQEFGSPTNVKWYDAALKAIGLTNVEAYMHDAKGKLTGKWRVIYYDPKIFTRLKSGLYTIGPKLKDDVKYMAECILADGSRPYYFASGHVENDDASGDTQVAQIEDCFRRRAEAAKTNHVAPEDCILGFDTNSRNRVREWVEANTDYRDAAGLAKSAQDVSIKSINGWKTPVRGDREDYIFVHKNRLVQSFDQRDAHTISDHDPQIITIN